MKVFISYAREDIEIAKKLYLDLKKAGISPWMDRHDLLPGQNWRVLIPKAIQESKYFLAVLSSNSLSKKGFVQRELKMALDILEEFPSAEDIFIIPIRIEDCDPEDEKLKYLHWADFFPSYEEGLGQIGHRINVRPAGRGTSISSSVTWFGAVAVTTMSVRFASDNDMEHSIIRVI